MNRVVGLTLYICFSLYIIIRRRSVAEQWWDANQRYSVRPLLDRWFGPAEPRNPNPPKYYEYSALAGGSLFLVIGLIFLGATVLSWFN